MLNRLLVVLVALLCAAFTFPVNSLAQTSSPPAKDWPDTNPTRTTTQNGEKAVPVHDISGLWSGLWGARLGNQVLAPFAVGDVAYPLAGKGLTPQLRLHAPFWP